MICPYCGEDDDKVIDSRSSDGGLMIRRRRQCVRCARRYTTYERVEKTTRLVVVKKDESRVAFDAGNIMRGIRAACGKRPIPEPEKERLVREIEDELHREFDREVPSHEIGRRVATRLRQLDPIAYIRYASEYHEFRSLKDFDEELRELAERPTPPPNQADLFEE